MASSSDESLLQFWTATEWSLWTTSAWMMPCGMRCGHMESLPVWSEKISKWVQTGIFYSGFQQNEVLEIVEFGAFHVIFPFTSCSVYSNTQFTSSHVKQHRKKSDQIRAFLDYLEKRPRRDFDQFCNCLIGTHQGHVVSQYLRLDLPLPSSDIAPGQHSSSVDWFKLVNPEKNV